MAALQQHYAQESGIGSLKVKHNNVLGYFIEVVSGKPFDVFLKERLFDPLGMEDTWFYLPEKKAERLVKEEGWQLVRKD